MRGHKYVIRLRSAALQAALPVAVSLACALAPAFAQAGTGGYVVRSQADSTADASAAAASEVTAADIKVARDEVKAKPEDAKARYQLAELLRRAGRPREAAQEYLEVTQLDPTMFIAYHQIATIAADSEQIADAVERLNKARLDKPQELMLHVALSELLEKQQNYYQAARILIDLVYANGVPDKHKSRINARIHYLLARSKDAQASEKQVSTADEEMDLVPAPLPESSLRKGLTASKVKEPREMKGMGHVPLLP